MNRIQTGLYFSVHRQLKKMVVGLFLIAFQVTCVWADGIKIENLDFSVFSGDKLQLQMDLSGPVPEPKVFHTDNPARIAIDLPGVESALDKKVFPVNTGAVNTVYAIESAGRLRIVINLVESVPFETKLAGNKLYVTINSAKETDTIVAPVVIPRKTESNVVGLIPKQHIKNLDFRRGAKGEGRLLVSLTSPNTVVDTSEKGGKVVINFLNTELPRSLVKRMDVSDFATPVQYIDAESIGSKTRIRVTLSSGNYDYSSFQSKGLLTVEFRPLTKAEKEEAKRKKFKYVGERLSLNFQDIEVRSVLQILADFTDLNIIAADSVGGSVTLRLNDVPWDQALDLILKSKGLAKRQSGNVVMVAPTAEINKIEKEELAAKKVIEELEPLRTEYIQVNYAKAENFRNLLLGFPSTGGTDGCSVTTSTTGGSTQSPLGGGARGRSGGRSRVTGVDEEDRYTLLSRRGTAIVDSRTNTLIVRDTTKQLGEIRKLLQLLDVPVRQVMIESRIVIADTTFARELGVRFSVNDVSDVGNEKTLFTDAVSDLALGGASGTLGLTLVKAADYVLNLELEALEDEGKGEILSNPRVMTSDRCEAIVKSGTQIPYSSGDIQNRTVTLVDAVLELKVTPQITPQGSVIMDLNIKNDEPGDTQEVGLVVGDIPIDTREIQTSVRVDNGETLVIGGIYETTNRYNQEKVPWLADIPGVGFLFKNTRTAESRSELLIFVTPKIIKQM